MEYTTLLYIPAKAPFDLYHSEKANGLSLYVKRVFIMSDCKELLPTVPTTEEGEALNVALRAIENPYIASWEPTYTPSGGRIQVRYTGTWSDLAKGTRPASTGSAK